MISITFWTVEDLRIVLVSLHLLIKSSITQSIKKKKKISCMFRIIPKSIIRPMNSSKNKLNSKKSWLFKQCQMHTSFLYNDSLSCLKRKVCMPDPNDSRSFEVGLPINLFWVGNEFPTMVKSLWGQPNVDTMEESPPKFCYVLETIYIASSRGITFFILLLEIWVWSLYSFLSLCCMS